MEILPTPPDACKEKRKEAITIFVVIAGGLVGYYVVRPMLIKLCEKLSGEKIQ